MNLDLRKTGAFFVLVFFILSNLPIATLYAEDNTNIQDERTETTASWAATEAAMTTGGVSQKQTVIDVTDNTKDNETADNSDNAVGSDFAAPSNFKKIDTVASGSTISTAAIGATSSGMVMSGSTSTGSFLPQVIDYSKYKYYSGTFVRDGKTYGNSLYSDDLGFSNLKDKNVQIKSYDEYMRTPKGKQKQWALSEAPMMMSMSAPTSGLIWSWDLNGNANDTSGYGNNGTPTNVTWVDGKFWQAWSFAWVPSSSIYVPTSPSLETATVTVSAWIKTYWVQWNIYWVIIRKDTVWSPRYLWWFSQVPNSNTITFHNYNSSAIYSVSKATDSNWHHYVWVISGSNGTMSLYYDGWFVASTTIGSFSNPLSQLSFGRDPITNDLNWNGQIDGVKIYNRSLSASEIQSLYNDGWGAAPISNTTYSSVPTSTTNQVLANPLSKYDFTDPSSCMLVSNDQQAANAATAQKESDNKGDPVTLSKGEFTYDNTLMNIPGKKIPFEFKLSYKNQVYYNGPAGINWDHNYNIYLTTEANGNVLYQNGRLGVFRFLKNGSIFDYNEGLKASLALSGSVYVMSFDSGDKHTFNAAQRISRIEDANGNHIDFSYTNELLSSVTDTLGRAISYSYYDHNRLKDVTDFNGRKVTMNYLTGTTASGSLHDLQNVAIDNGNGAVKAIGFEYTVGGDTITNHNITKLIDSKNQAYVVNTYDAGDRVASQKYGNGTINYAYVLSGNSVTKNTVLDKLGNKTEYTYDANGNQTQVKYFNEAQTGSLDYAYEYNANGFLSKETKPRGNGFTYSYDTKWNLLEKRMKADMGAASSGSDLVTTTTYNARGQVLTETRTNGIVMTNVFDASGNLTSKITSGINSHSGAVSNAASTFTYSGGGFLDSMVDGEGTVTKFQYGSGQVSKIIRGTGSSTSTGSFAYDAYGNATASTDGAWWAKYAAYDAFGLLSTGTTAEGIVTSYGYDANNNKISENRYLSGWAIAKSKFFYDLLDNMTGSLIDTSSGKALLSTFKYDLNANVIERKIGSGALVKYSYNEFGKMREERIVMNPSDSSKDIVTVYAYDANNNVIRKTDPLGRITSYTYDLFDRVSKETDPKGTYTTYAYDLDGRVNSRSVYSSGNALLQKSAYLYDGLGNVVKTIDYLDPAGSSGGVETKTTYNKNGKKKTVTDSLGNTTTNSYDVLGRLASTTDALGNAVTYAYDKRDLAISKSIVPNTGTGVITTISAFDKDGRLVGETDNLGQTKTFTYNSLGQVVSSKDEANNITAFELDYTGKITKEIKYLSGTSVTTKYAYDERGNLVTVIDPKNNETMYIYDGLNRNTDVIYADGKGLSYTYDKNSNLVSQIDPNGTVTTNSYGTTNLLTARSIATGTGVAWITSETYTHDALGRVISGTDSSANKIDFGYDALGRLLSETNSGIVVVHAYDTNGNLSKITYPDGRESAYAYDSLNRVTGISFSGASIASYAYTGIVNTSISYGNGKTTNQTYDQLMRLKTLSNGVNAYAYSYDAVGNITSDSKKSYTYDTIYRLIGSSTAQSGTVLESFSYDNAGNRVSDGSNMYTTNALNQYTALTGATSTVYAFDGNGNTTSDGKYGFQYDYKNRLVKVSSGSTVVGEYRYDVLGRRIEKKVGDEVTKYTYAGKNILTEARTKNGVTFRKTYINGLGTDNVIAYDNEEINLTSAEKEELGFCADQVLSATGRFLKYGYAGIVDRCNALSNSGASVVVNRYYFHKNHLGSVIGLTNSAGAVVVEYDYDAFGNTYFKTGTGAFEKIDSATTLAYDNHRLFTAREYDNETGLYFLRARYYDSATGRFISRDPIGQVDDLNLYGYVGNSPFMGTDPDGTVKLAIARGAKDYRAFLRSEIDGDNLLDAYWAGVSEAALGYQLGFLENLGSMSNSEIAKKWSISVALIFPWGKWLRLGGTVIQWFSKHINWWVGFKSFSALKTYLGKAGDWNAIHHIVEQHAANIARFWAEVIHNTKNTVELAHRAAGSIHREISGYYSSIDETISKTKTVRDVVKNWDFDKQYEFWKATLQKFMK